MTKEKILSKSVRVIFSGSVALGLGIFSQAVFAQEAVQRVEITGSNIKRTEAEGISNTQVVSRKDIEQSGKTSIADVVRSLSADNNGTISGAFTNGFAGSASGVSLRGLSVNSTLVLINGRRTAPYGFNDDGARSFVDLNSIPLDAVDRIEVLKDGASAIYGSDAIAGVVNVILRQNYQGKSISASTGTSGHGDGTMASASATVGFGDLSKDRYNFFVNIDAKKSEKILQSNRGDYIGQADARPWDGRDQRAGSTTTSNTGGSSLVGTVRPVNAAGGTIAGRGIQNLPGCNPADIDLTGGTPKNTGGGCLWDPVKFATIQPETQNINLFARGTFQLNNDTQAYVEGGVFNSKAKTQTTPSGMTGTGFDLVNQRVNNTATGPDQILLPIGHPDNPFPANAARPRFAAASKPRTADLDTTVTRVLGGFKGTFADWDYDTAFMYAESKTDKTQNGYYRTSALKAALANGSYRIGQNFNLNSAATLAAVFPELDNSGTSKLTSVDFKATRELFQLPGGASGIAVGAEFRREEVNSEATPFTNINDIPGLGYAAAQGKRNVSALYAELALPVIKNLEISLAARTDHYSDYGSSTTPKVGFKFTPAAIVAFRGSFAEGFRAPSFAENGNSATSAFTNFNVDPVRCPVTHLAQDCTDTKSIGAVTVGNKNVKPEDSKSYSLGMVLEPVKNFSVAVDLWRIVRNNEIIGADPTAAIANPAGNPNAVIVRGEPTSDFPGLAGPILLVKAPYINANKTETSGVDLDFRGRYDLGSNGKLNGGLIITYMEKFKRTNADGTVQEFAGTHGDTNLSGDGGTPRTRASFNLGWERGPFTLAGTVNYVSGISDTNELGGDCLDVDANGKGYLGCRIASFTTMDVFGKWKVSKQWEVTASITNLFDRMAPLDVQTYGRINYNPSLHQSGAVGRYFTIGGRYTF
ncbi:MAG: TonB-dependent receptor [Pseudomonadota bacterium]